MLTGAPKESTINFKYPQSHAGSPSISRKHQVDLEINNLPYLNVLPFEFKLLP